MLSDSINCLYLYEEKLPHRKEALVELLIG